MSTAWPPLDTHAHIDVSINPDHLLKLRAVIFAANRSLEDSKIALDRQHRDLLTVWGVGVHPCVKASLEGYDAALFDALLQKTAYVGEIGLDGKVKSRLDQQRDVFTSILKQLQQQPRLTSIHSYGATVEVIDELERTPIKGAILHWWLGDSFLIRRAVDVGAYFSLNTSNARHTEIIGAIPLDRLLIETDHPNGNRSGPKPRQPGNVTDVEEILAKRHGVSPANLRTKVWENLATLVRATTTHEMLPPKVRAILDAIG